MIDTTKADVLVLNELADVILTAVDSVEEKITECLSNLFTMVPCFQQVSIRKFLCHTFLT